MKTGISLIAILTFSALVIPPILPKIYPSNPVVRQREDVAVKEKELQETISKIENAIKKDSIKIDKLKQQKKDDQSK
ncbi:hypothetical protein [Flavobacterium psychrophilum]|uniref:hypothetical protein n=1 Tax=Flavobacterium psychrophilum TaxID=96345 RepID=UPI00106C15A1|nr:hypothetical protein [Flavobacterium psychrophilum]MCB6097699.1 hypothetical protein [Flavobacterium psychrophilum]